MISAMLLFLGADVAFISHSIDVTIRHGASMMIMFGFEVAMHRMISPLTVVYSTRRYNDCNNCQIYPQCH